MRNTRNKKLVGATMATAVILLGGLAGCGKQETSETLVADARQFIQKGDTKAAVIQLKNALVKNPSNVEARLTLGTLYNDSGDGTSAEKEIRKAASLGAGPDKTMYPLATALLMQGQLQKVLDETAAAATGNDAAILTLRADALLGLGKADQSKQAYELALKASPGDARATIGLARHALTQKDIASANALVEQAVAAHPADAMVWQFKGDLLRAQGKADDALAAYSQVLKIKPDHRSANLEKAYIEISERKFDAAKANIDAARKITPNSLMVSYTQALLEFTQGKHAAAKESLQKVLRAAPEHMPSILLAGAVEHALGSMTQAELHLRKYLQASPGHVYARKMLVTTLLKLGQTSAAKEFLAPLMADAGNDPQLLAMAGEVAMQARDFGKATEYFEKASKLAPKVAALRTSLALSTLAQGDDARAISELEQSTKLDTSSPKAAVLLVLTEMRLKHYDKALAAANALEAEQPKESMVHNLKGGVYLARKELANARASFEKALALQPNNFAAVSNLAQMAMQENKPQQARELLVAFLEKDKKHVEAMSMLARLALAAKKPDEAVQWMERASNENPDAVAPAMRLASHYLRSGQKEKAQTLARKFVIAHPDSAQALDMLGQTQLAHGDQTGALETYSKLVNVAPKSALAQMRLASVQLGGKNEAAAAESLKKAVALEPGNVDARLLQAELLARKGRFDQALAVAQQVQKLKPKQAIGFVLEGNLLSAQGKPALAVRAFEQALALENAAPSMIKLHGALGRAGKAREAGQRMAQWQKDHPADNATVAYQAELDLGAKDYPAAIAKLEAVAKRAPGNPGVLNNLAWAYQQIKDPRALATAEQAFKAAPDSAAVMDTLGWMLVEQGNTTRGLPLLKQAAAKAPDAYEIRYHFALALQKSGDKSGARTELRKLVSAGKAFAQIEEARALLKTL